MPAGIRVLQGVVHHVHVAVVVLAFVWGLDVGVGADKPPHFWVVQPRIHVDQAEVVEVFVSGEATGCPCLEVGVSAAGDGTFAERVVADALDDGAVAVGEGVDIAQSVLMQIPRFIRGFFRAVFEGTDLDGDHFVTGVDLVFVLGHTVVDTVVVVGDFKRFADVSGGFRLARGAVDLLDALLVGIVQEGGGAVGLAITDFQRLVVACPFHHVVARLQHIAVGIVAVLLLRAVGFGEALQAVVGGVIYHAARVGLVGEVAVHVIAVAEIEAAFTAVGGTHRTGEAVEGIVAVAVGTATHRVFAVFVTEKSPVGNTCS